MVILVGRGLCCSVKCTGRGSRRKGLVRTKKPRNDECESPSAKTERRDWLELAWPWRDRASPQSTSVSAGPNPPGASLGPVLSGSQRGGWGAAVGNPGVLSSHVATSAPSTPPLRAALHPQPLVYPRMCIDHEDVF